MTEDLEKPGWFINPFSSLSRVVSTSASSVDQRGDMTVCAQGHGSGGACCSCFPSGCSKLSVTESPLA